MQGYKLNIEDVRKIFLDNKCELLEEVYKGKTHKLSFRCHCGNIYHKLLYGFKKNPYCKLCGKNYRVLTYNASRIDINKDKLLKIRENFKESNCTLLSDVYKNEETKLNYICSCGNKAITTWSMFKEGKRCKKCSVARRKYKSDKFYTYEEVKQYYIDNGCKLLADKYINISTIMEYICNCGMIYGSTFGTFKAGHRCFECGIKKRIGANNWGWIEDREKAKFNKKFSIRCGQLIWRILKKTEELKECNSEKIVGYTRKQLLDHLQSHSNWNSVKDKVWHIDHIFPIKAFLDHNIKDPKIINSLDNLQPLLDIENYKKNDTYNEENFIKYLLSKGIENVKNLSLELKSVEPSDILNSIV